MITLRTNDSGSVSVVGGIMLTCMMLAVAVSLTLADAFSIRSQAQEALDAAVIAGTSAPNSLRDEDIISLAQNVYVENRTRRMGENANIELLSRANATFRVTTTMVTGEMTFDLQSPFLGFLGRNSLAIKVESGAKRSLSNPICLIGLDQNQAATIDLNGRASVDLENCAAMANSSSGEAISQVGNRSSFRATEIGVHGGYSGSGFSPTPTPGMERVADPLASLPEPTPGACHPDSGAVVQQAVRTLTPGTYCGGFTARSGSVITLTPGIYIFLDGPLRIDSQSAVSGNEVMIAFQGPNATLEVYSGGSLDVTSPTSGTYANIQFFGDRKTYAHNQNAQSVPPGQDGGHLWFTVIGDSRLTYDGVIYMPMHHIWWAGGSVVTGRSPNYTAIAKKLWFQDNTQVRLSKENRRGLDVAEPVSLMQMAVLYR